MNTATSTAHKVTRHAVVKGRILRLVEVERVEEFLFSLYKKLFHFKAFLFEAILRFPPPPLQSLPYSNTIARPLRNVPFCGVSCRACCDQESIGLYPNASANPSRCPVRLSKLQSRFHNQAVLIRSPFFSVFSDYCGAVGLTISSKNCQ